MCALVDARFAGGSILVSPKQTDDIVLVQVDLPGLITVDLFPEEAKALAAALTRAAGVIQ